eukprot:TRINITY_DN45925_c0_g1_i1.p1 TRINITY_DN45925_c0_g1~~TRINITY_DN45925_c0_g1_i1.p1  ORF type:complete len:282 (-),score=66.71 TRINITY_DN45925_c0_g1_i1:161-1006(-)
MTDGHAVEEVKNGEEVAPKEQVKAGEEVSPKEQEIFFSLNPKVTAPELLPAAPPQEELDELAKYDPKLRYTWAVWDTTEVQFNKKSDAAYADSTHKVTTFNTVKEFWSIFSYLPQPSELMYGKKFLRQRANGAPPDVVESIMIFRDGIRPEWEDVANADGGHFELRLRPNLKPAQMDEIWNNIVIGIISGMIEPADMLNGVRLVDKLNSKVKNSVKIEVWFNDMDPGDTGRLYDLRGNFERCLRTSLSGIERECTWGYTETKPHKTPDEKSKPSAPARGGR